MIGKLRGIVDSINEDSAIIDVGGVGYNVFCSGKTLGKFPESGSAVNLYIETHVREDHIHLYGFTEKIEQEWFLILNTVQGVGTRLALAILSVLSPEQLISAIASQDKLAFKQISGVGPKLSERIIVELKSKVKGINIDSLSSVAKISGRKGGSAADDNLTDAISALVNLGYNRSDAYTVIVKIANKNENIKTQELIREGLRELGR